jgi:RNA polymerase II subunit A C-terminal domain phosphatase SSU72
MEAHVVLGNAGLVVESYGTGTTVRLPGRSAMEPRIFKFGTPYADMYASLAATPDDEAYFAHNGVLNLCRRGASVKLAPQRWQDTPTTFIAQHDIVIAFEERIFDAVVEDLQMREPTEDLAPIHVICLDTKDNPQEAKIQGRIALELCWILEKIAQQKVKSVYVKTSRKEAAELLMNEIPEILESFQEERMTDNPVKILYQLCFL